LRGIYTISIWLYSIAIRIFALFNAKAKLWHQGRKLLFVDLSPKMQALPVGAKIVWVHCASLGEFEQARPVIEAIKKEHSNVSIVLSFFSPSGYEVRKNYALADVVCYLPADTPANARRFISIVKPEILILIKYEFWFNHLAEAHKQGCKLFLVAGRFRKDQLFFKWGMQWFKKQLALFEMLHVQDDASERVLKEHGISSVLVSGDPRYDRVAQNASEAKEIKFIDQWINGRNVWVAGSTWPEDEAVLFPWNATDFALIIAPHHVSEKRLLEIENCCNGSSVRYSSWIKGNMNKGNVLIIDNVGMLMHIYNKAHIAYVGGGFRSGLHNILEPAAFGIPVVFGPLHDKFPEAQGLIDAGGALEVSSKLEFTDAISRFRDHSVLSMGENARKFVMKNTGATRKIMDALML
jgi:3-deoxy-D-manno-octulosonic-acid transferase